MLDTGARNLQLVYQSIHINDSTTIYDPMNLALIPISSIPSDQEYRSDEVNEKGRDECGNHYDDDVDRHNSNYHLHR